MYVAQLMRESSTTSNDFLPHASLSLDYGSDSPVSHVSLSLSLCDPIVQLSAILSL